MPWGNGPWRPVFARRRVVATRRRANVIGHSSGADIGICIGNATGNGTGPCKWHLRLAGSCSGKSSGTSSTRNGTRNQFENGTGHSTGNSAWNDIRNCNGSGIEIGIGNGTGNCIGHISGNGIGKSNGNGIVNGTMNGSGNDIGNSIGNGMESCIFCLDGLVFLEILTALGPLGTALGHTWIPVGCLGGFSAPPGGSVPFKQIWACLAPTAGMGETEGTRGHPREAERGATTRAKGPPGGSKTGPQRQLGPSRPFKLMPEHFT